MKKEKKLLLSGSIISILYIVIELLTSLYGGFVMGKNDTTLANIIGSLFVYIPGIIGSIFFLYYSKENVNIEKKKNMIIFWSILLLLISFVPGILGFIVVHNINKKNMRKLPKLDIQQNYKWYIYLIVFIIWAGIMFGLSNLYTKTIHSIITYIFFVLMLGFIFRKDLIRDFKYFKKYFKEYLSIVIEMFGKSFLILVILTLSIRLYTGLDTATNQETLNTLFSSKPLFVAVLAMFYAPFVEELLFRGIFRKIMNNKWLYIIISGVLFGIAHVIDDFQSAKELLFILVYSSLGCFLAATYYKTNNIFTNMMFHFIQNTLAVIGMIIISFLPKLLEIIF